MCSKPQYFKIPVVGHSISSLQPVLHKAVILLRVFMWKIDKKEIQEGDKKKR